MGRTRASMSEGLCCCEYENIKGERSHVLAVLCDCEAVDSCCDFCLRCQPIPEKKLLEVIDTVEDRCRIPYCGGALKLSLEACLPVLILLSLLCIGSSGFYYTLICIPSYIPIILFLARLFSMRGRTRIYVNTTYASTIILFIIFITIVTAFRKILLWEIMTLCTMAYFCLQSVRNVQKDPGYLKPDKLQQPHSSTTTPSLVESEVTWVDSPPNSNNRTIVHCDQCQLKRPLRSGHCKTCVSCVIERDHHCVWLDTCIGKYNHRSFFFCLLISTATLSYGTHLTWTTLCTPEIYLDWFLFPADCRFIYNDFPSGLSVAGACYATLILFFILLLFLQQCILISQNVTGRELHNAKVARRTKWFGFVATGNVNNKGFSKNWIDFLKKRRVVDKFEIINSV